MERRLHNLFRLDQYTLGIERLRARNTAILTGVLGFCMAMFFLYALTVSPDGSRPTYVVIGILGMAAAWVSTYFIRHGGVVQSGGVLVAVMGIIIIPVYILVSDTAYDLVLAWFLPLIASGVMNRRLVIYSILGAIGLQLFWQFLYLTFNAEAFVGIFGLIFVNFWAYNTVNSFLRSIQGEFQRNQLLQTSNAVSRNISRRLGLEELLQVTAENIKDQFETIYHAQVFLIDRSGRNAVLRASTGEVGKKLLARNHMLPVGSQSVVGRATQRGQYVLIADATQDPTHKRNELLPATRTELALPLRIAEGVIGALDLQSLIPDAFSPSDVDVLQSLADQVALAIENARLLDSLQEQLRQNQEIIEREHAGKLEIEQLNRELMGKGWANYLYVSKPVVSQTLDIDSGIISPGTEISPKSRESMQSGEVQLERFEDKQILYMPIIVEQIPLGVIEFELPKGEIIDAGVMDALFTLRDRLGILVENVRLFDQARTVASREQVVNETATRLLQSRDLSSLLHQAAPLFNQIMGAQGTRIRLGEATLKSIQLDDGK